MKLDDFDKPDSGWGHVPSQVIFIERSAPLVPD